MARTQSTRARRRTVGRTSLVGGRDGARDRPDAGFTLIELLVVMIIIGVLAAISVPVFLNQRKKAVDTQVKTDLRTVAVSMETYYTDKSAYPPATADVTQSGNKVTVGGSVTSTLSQNDTMVYKGPTDLGRTAFCLKASNPAGSQTWVYISDQGGLQPSGTMDCS